jgi:uncharacterized protein (TIGR03086 family)
MEAKHQLDTVIPALLHLVDGIKPDQLDKPTPCTEWNVRDLVAHLVGGGHMFASAFRGGPGPQMVEGAMPDIIGDRSPGEALAASCADFGAAVAEAGAAERMVTLPFGEMPGEAVMRLAAADLVIHGWDLAQATGLPWAPDEELVTEALAFERQAVGPAMRGANMPFGPELPASAGAAALEQLVAFSGRQP